MKWYQLIDAIAALLITLNFWLINKIRKDNKPDTERLATAVHDKRNNLPPESSDTLTLGNLATGLLEEINRIHERLDAQGFPPAKRNE